MVISATLHAAEGPEELSVRDDGKVEVAVGGAKVVTALDPALAPVTYLAALWLKALRRAGGEGLRRLPRCRQTLRAVGIYPVRDHYYEPLLQPDHLRRPLDVDRDLPGLDLNVAGQLAMLDSFSFAPELTQLAMDVTPDHRVLLQ